ncbi:DUF2971 domain-containing protein [Methylacidimicrobium sp. B4]|uniref:DUF2971 domain-containing protein n=1 Tax=Methylacidimicrobium sp. B4 TaxID=2796139 RepID=UPI001A8C5D46|nr:DUF2971 domain-containing protein [Methylacidimicrobium sp. B4]QSR83901.1 DUF2971 domain-containing protein [Methylacidimicrobium sp. B4]
MMKHAHSIMLAHLKQYTDALQRYFDPIWDQIRLKEGSPTPLYHYTTGENFIKIIESRELWATHVRCLNDKQECLLYYNLIAQKVKERTSQPNPERLPARIAQSLSAPLAGLLGDYIDQSSVFVACFSTLHDDLSQWRAYSNGEVGYAIGFNAEKLTKLFSGRSSACRLIPDPKLSRVLYEPAEHESLVNQIVDAVEACVKNESIFESDLLHDPDRALPKSEEEAERGPEIGAAAASLLSAVAAFAPCLKDRSFRAEQEWRLIYIATEGDGERMHFTQRGGFLSRHVALPLDNVALDRMKPLIEKIVIGPGGEPAVSRGRIEELLRAKWHALLGQDPIETSRIPLRFV